MSKITSLNPYRCLGVNPNSTLTELKKSYYNWAKLVHTDRGGNRDDFETIHYCYTYIKKQFENCKDIKSYEEQEKDFEDFCKNQTLVLPPFRKIFLESEEGEGFKKFNEKFEEMKKSKDLEFNDPFEKGYGYLMENSEKVLDYSEINLKKKIKNEFKRDIIKYENPMNLPIFYGINYDYKIKKIDDFTHILKNKMECTDYLKAYSNNEKLDIKYKKRTLEELMKERDNFDKLVVKELKCNIVIK